ncbi:MAG: hypothetical protein RsTaC01_0614 [Candidatus Paraimprobicoccus trichonymphae]|uniref:Transglutaminase-like domain-containing protein n=1 Tax=Candidatus Paraimprobicoccus trichonymphae TaxID=3033793 RepID=A0AA48IC31_9FIRM|nr:MAG: hypothetical protein RsTaC01_0614 [Candidatus Paraimprobicoccus trichonymphae]
MFVSIFNIYSFNGKISPDQSIMEIKNQKCLYENISINSRKILTTRKNDKELYEIEPIVIYKKFSSKEIQKAFYEFFSNHPEIFWISNYFEYFYNPSENCTCLKIYSNVSLAELEIAEKRLQEKLNSILIKINFNSSDYEKELFVHDWIVENCTYYKEGNYKIFTSYGCLVDCKAVCEGYAKATQLILTELGVRCRTVSGVAHKEPHMWNIVEIEGEYYHLDVTWDCGKNDLTKYFYFNLSDELIKDDHMLYPFINKIEDLESLNYYNTYNLGEKPICNSYTYTYISKNSFPVNLFNKLNLLLNYISCREIFYIKLNKNQNISNIENILFTNKSPLFLCLKQLGKDNITFKYIINETQNVVAIKLKNNNFA